MRTVLLSPWAHPTEAADLGLVSPVSVVTSEQCEHCTNVGKVADLSRTQHSAAAAAQLNTQVLEQLQLYFTRCVPVQSWHDILTLLRKIVPVLITLSHHTYFRIFHSTSYIITSFGLYLISTSLLNQTYDIRNIPDTSDNLLSLADTICSSIWLVVQIFSGWINDWMGVTSLSYY